MRCDQGAVVQSRKDGGEEDADVIVGAWLVRAVPVVGPYESQVLSYCTWLSFSRSA